MTVLGEQSDTDRPNHVLSSRGKLEKEDASLSVKTPTCNGEWEDVNKGWCTLHWSDKSSGKAQGTASNRSSTLTLVSH